MRLYKRLSLLLACSLLASSTPIYAQSPKSDITGHWAESVFKTWIDNNYISGYGNGNYHPDNTVTKAEFATLLTNIIKPANITPIDYADVTEDNWYYNAVQAALATGCMTTDENGLFNPDAFLTREDIALALDTLMRFQPNPDSNALEHYTDVDHLDPPSQEAFENVVDKALFVGFDNQLTPNASVTRAETLALLSRLTGTILSESGTYTDSISGNVTITTADVQLNNMTIDGDLYLAEGVTAGDITLDNIIVTGDIFINSSTATNILLHNTSIEGRIIVSSLTGDSTLTTTGTTSNLDVFINTDCTLSTTTQTEATYNSVVINPINDETTITINAAIEQLHITNSDSPLTLDTSKEAKINTLATNRPTNIIGSGSVTNLFVSGTTVTSANIIPNIILDANATVTANDKVIEQTTITDQKALDTALDKLTNNAIQSMVDDLDIPTTPNGGGGHTDTDNDDDDDDIPTDTNKMLADFQDGIPDFARVEDAEMTLVENHLTSGNKALQVDFNAADFPAVKFKADVPFNLGEERALSLKVTNPTDQAITFHVRIDDDPSGNGGNEHSKVSIATIAPHTTETVFVSCNPDALDLGMRGLPPNPNGRDLGHGWGAQSVDLTNIVEFQFWLMYNKDPNATLIFDDICSIPDPNVDLSYMNNIVDKYGQYAEKDWDGKVQTDQDLKDFAAKEKEELAETGHLASETTTKYGGYKDENLKQEATGFFRTEYLEEEGKWTLIDPEGYPYFATGLDCVRFTDGGTWLDGRRNMFADVPDNKGQFEEHFSIASNVARPPLGLESGEIFNFYTANLERKYGDNYTQEWIDTTVARFKSWGFTSIGNWSDPEGFFGKGADHQIPYSANAWLNGNHTRLSSGNLAWGALSDPFDPEFRNSVITQLNEVNAYGVGDDPWCMGIYIDNEIAWGNPNSIAEKYAVITTAFKSDVNDASVYAKKAFITELKSIHGTIDALNASWGTDLTDWTTLEKSYTFPATITDGMEADLSALLYMLADEYYSIVDEELTRIMPNILNLGSRFAEWGTSMEVQEACAKYADVVSFNVYKANINEEWIYADELNKPLIVGEFHFGATDRGMFMGGLQTAANQADRGIKYEDYIEVAANSKYFVGAHWFQYMDQPLTGRAWDGENYNTGFVDVTDMPYPDLVNSAKEVHSNVYDIRFNKVAVESVSLDQAQATIDVTTDTKTLQLTATVKPDNATFKEVKWTSSDETIAKVDAKGLVTPVGNGEVTITATAVDNPEVKANCVVTVKGFQVIEATFPHMDFTTEASLVLVKDYIAPESATSYKLASITTQSGINITTESGILVSTQHAAAYPGDGAYSSRLYLNPTEESWSLGMQPTLTLDAVNPHDKALQLRLEIKDMAGKLRTYYFNFKPHEKRTLVIDTFGPAKDNWDPVDGYFGAGDTGLDITAIESLSFLIYEGGAEQLTTTQFMLQNINLIDHTSTPTFPHLTFDEAPSFLSTSNDELELTYADGAVTFKATGELTNYPSIVLQNPDSTWSMGKNTSLVTKVVNTANKATQVRIDLVDSNGSSRTFWRDLPINTDVFDFSISAFTDEAGSWGSGTLDSTQIKTIKIYLGEGSIGKTFEIHDMQVISNN